RAKFGQSQTLVTAASQYGKQIEQFNGVDIGINARFRRGGFVQGGVSTAHLVTDTCFVVDTPQLARDGFCRVDPPWSAGTPLKVHGSFPLPWDFETSFNLQNLPGVSVGANWAAPNAAIAPSLGRNLSSCATPGSCTATATVALIQPGTMFLDRITTVDVRFAKIVGIRNGRIKGTFDIGNLFNT